MKFPKKKKIQTAFTPPVSKKYDASFFKITVYNATNLQVFWGDVLIKDFEYTPPPLPPSLKIEEGNVFLCVCGLFPGPREFLQILRGGLNFELCTLTGVLDLYSQPFRVPVVLCPEVLSPFRSFTISEFYPFWKAGASLKRFIQSRSHSWQVRVGGILFSSEDPNHILYLQEEMYFPIKRFPLKRDRNI